MIKYYWFTLFPLIIIAGFFIFIKLRVIYIKYTTLKVKENPSFNTKKHQYWMSNEFVISVFPIKEKETAPELIKLKDNYNRWIKIWWYLMGLTLLFTVIGIIINAIITL